MTVVSIDGVLVAPDQANISIFDRGLLYGDGCFEVLRTWEGVARDLDAHLDRLYATAQFLAMQTLERTAVREAVYRTIAVMHATEPERVGEFRIRIVLTRGPGNLAQPFAELGRGRAIVIVEALPPTPSELSLAIVDWPTTHGHGHKTLSYLDPLIASELARAAGADEAVRLDAKGHVVEGATSNVFLVEHGKVATPRLDEGALPGIVRARVLEVCARESITAAERLISLRDLRGADEIFVTSSIRGVVAVTRLDGLARPSGPVTALIARAYATAMRAVP